MSQTSYSDSPAVGFRGLLSDPNDDSFAIPLAYGAAAAQGFGIMVKRDKKKRILGLLVSNGRVRNLWFEKH